MKTGLAIWHYPHRTLAENAAYFIDEGYDSVSILGSHFCAAVRDPEEGALLAKLVGESGVELTVHHKLPSVPAGEETDAFFADMRAVGAWQEKYGLISVLSFDVGMRLGLLPHLRFVLDHVPGCRVAVEDYGITPEEAAHVAPLREEPRFGYLMDIGHMFIYLHRLQGAGMLATLRPDRGADEPIGEEDYLAAFRFRDFPLVEMHLHNNDGVRDLHRFLEEGSLDVPAVARVLRRIGYDGIVTIESAPGYTFPCYGQEADDRIRATRAYWERCLEAAGEV